MSLNPELRKFAFEELYLLPQSQERSSVDPQALLAVLSVDERARVHDAAARRLALQILFEMDARGISEPQFVHATLAQVEGLGPIAADRVATTVINAHAQRTKADAVFRELAPEWPTHRLAGVDRALLRLGYYEIASGTTPVPIILNEAVELAKHFSTDRSPAFINALLDKAAQKHAAANAPKGGA